ncbi:DNA repair protein RadA [Bifidobacterium psychraerophilum]|jgi:DNA repair protein RadA/Sms|uniref:DNA repair protein RadA n=1 Tax=Bifidobacterium psychraerophilum TaxID=218140 RepID=UPI00052989C7|nr:DNA repair protein RadA [Bifidobacterium psychraerophilum]MCI1661186.1 DNA repair protein RadA [Bifidobacterium psychraerophilum]MCI1804062.1 DNA repair protein RadA [Bifidobacterium psychraerophilum]MCI2176577.1 DNA repair protein RadA [Bifidobacterium psychraerophilum]MCI2182323.1 DNA repair protein RadA [Bifidobacterium psychraerophilum]PKA95020.1 DNA repair protein RadA/Sms [Bifidobacterium psychraerophilum DSM 22366]
MAKSATQYVCTECGWTGVKWFGRCPQCGEWGTIEEFHEARPNAYAASSGGKGGRTRTVASGSGKALPITKVGSEHVSRISTGFEEFDRVLGGGIIPGSVVLIAGEPGVGKSTLLLETAGRVAKEHQGSVLYISGEESQSQVRMRASRVDAVEDELLLASTTDLGTVLGLIDQEHPRLVIVDSAQTISSQDVDGIPGGSTQVREVASALIDMAKTRDIPILLVGHVTKDGSIAGPRTLEHLVDVVCQFDGDPQTALRMLRAAKNRFGPTDEVGCFDMGGEGIEEVTDPAGLFLSADDAPVEGTCVTFTLDGHRSLPIEVQALVTNSVLPAPRRAANGIDSNRLAMLVAVLYRHGHIPLLANDLYVSTIAGGLAKEPACDLAVAAALASAARNSAIPRDTCAIGEISLTGQVRPAPRLEHRLREAARLGFTNAIVPAPRRGSQTPRIPHMNIIQVDSLRQALQALDIKV